MQVTYHSLHGALQESAHVYIEAGLKQYITDYPAQQQYTIFEMGFGTGLNALLTLIEAEQIQQKIIYQTIEAFPVEESIINQLNYCSQLNRTDLEPAFRQLHTCPWNEYINITPNFHFKKINDNLINFSTDQPINIIYYDAFAPTAQPELWSGDVFKKLYSQLTPGGILVTYCSKGDVRRNMQAAGFGIEKLPGPKGKREMMRVVKPG